MNSFCPENQDEWRAWLKENHLAEDFVWLIFYKKSSPNYNLSWSDAVDQALCFGWIDSTKKSIDDEKYMQYFCKRKPKSNWSKVNKEKIKRLVEQGLMEEAGSRSIEVAKTNGSWSFLDAIEALEVPDDLTAELAKHPGAGDYFAGLSKSAKKMLLYWVASAKRPVTRQKRVVDVATCASQGLMPKQLR